MRTLSSVSSVGGKNSMVYSYSPLSFVRVRDSLVAWAMMALVVLGIGISGSSEALAQSADTAPRSPEVLASKSESIGLVSKIRGDVKALSYYGTTRSLALNDLVYQGDLIETGPEGEVVVIFNDDTNIVIGAESRLSLDKMIYDRYAQKGNFASRLIQGSILFISGAIAKKDSNDMSFTTSVGTIGIRGTKGYLKMSEDGTVGEFWLLDPEKDIETAIVVRSDVGTVVLDRINTRVTVKRGEAISLPESADPALVSGQFRVIPQSAESRIAQTYSHDVGFVEAMWKLLQQRLSQ